MTYSSYSSTGKAALVLAQVKRARTPAKAIRLLLREARKRLLVHLANLKPVLRQGGENDPAYERFRQRWWMFSQESTQALLGLCEGLRKVWQPSTTLAEKEAILQTWLAENPVTRGRRGFAGLAAEAGMPLRVSLQRGEFIPNGLRASLVLGVFEQWRRFACCANKDCRHPYFLRERKTQRYCSEDCAEPAQRESKLRWWTEHGKQWRAKRRAQRKRKKGARR